MVEPQNPVLAKMLERLFASLVSGPSMNCRPHNSRQRVDWYSLLRFQDLSPADALMRLLGAEGEVAIAAKAPAPPRALKKYVEVGVEGEEQELPPEEQRIAREWRDQQALLSKLRAIADDARTYEQDTGVHALNVGFPVLHLPPGSFGGRGGPFTRRILAPIAFIPINLTVKVGTRQVVQVECRGGGIDRVIPNVALLAWLEQQAGNQLVELFADETGEQPWKEISSLIQAVRGCVDARCDDWLVGEAPPSTYSVVATPRSDAEGKSPSIVPAAVLGLFPASNQGLIRDTREMVTDGIADGPIESFVRHGVSLEAPVPGVPEVEDHPAGKPAPRDFRAERLVTHADPCQTKAVRMAQSARGLVIHGPPGTGKSQTIANVIGDHLGRGERVLFVCDKRTALDVVADRLGSIGLGDLCATVHDPQRDQREFYKSVREQLDTLSDTNAPPDALARLAKVDKELQDLHDDLRQFYERLMLPQNGAIAFHQLVGLWLDEKGDVAVYFNEGQLHDLSAIDFERSAARLREVLERAYAVNFMDNPWRGSVGLPFTEFANTPLDDFRRRCDRALSTASEADELASDFLPPFDAVAPLAEQGKTLADYAALLQSCPVLPQRALEVWLSRHPDELLKAAAGLEELSNHVRAEPILDAGFVDRLESRSPELLRQNARGLEDYLAAFGSRASVVAAARREAPETTDAVLTRWLSSDAKAVTTVKRRLETAKPIARSVRSQPLDPTLAARLAASPVEPAQRTQWLADLATYIESSEKLLSFLISAPKKAAQPVLRHFGLPLTPQDARRVHGFLSAVQTRDDLRAALKAAGIEEVDGEDAELLGTYDSHFATVTAVAEGGASVAPDVSGLAPDVVRAVNASLNGQGDGAKGTLEAFSLGLTPSDASRLRAFLAAAALRLELAERLSEAGFTVPPGRLPTDAELLDAATAAAKGLRVLASRPAVPDCNIVLRRFDTDETREKLLAALGSALRRGQALQAAEDAIQATGLLGSEVLTHLKERGRKCGTLRDALSMYTDRLCDVEGVLRVEDGLQRLPRPLAEAAVQCVRAKSEPKAAFSAIRRRVIEGEVRRRLREDPALSEVDGHRLERAFTRFRNLSETKKAVVLDVIKQTWVSRQRARLLATTGTRLNPLGADLRRRLTGRGDKAMRLRQVIAHGMGSDGGDPLFDLRPVWMASPETVAQLFPMRPIFDVVIFDEASQCRLEEALPVLVRAKRVVVAGDPKQLPPTRFFESTVSTSEELEGDSEQELFEAHQGEVEDLLTSALGLDISQTYLDVHYRSRNEDLIGFSNKHFYASRLQAIPGHPRNRIASTPVSLHRADGVYEKRQNIVEAEKVCQLVRELLSSPKPPSIGIASFNLTQRDLIVEKLEELADDDADFAEKLAVARERRGAGSSDGLFVKNLENVQGDERDHIIVSTTYGPTRDGKFRRAFGPLGMQGGGRRLNVLITRAREHLHVVTSIPRSAYSSLSPIPNGTTPGGAWLLFAYLQYIETLAEDYATAKRIIENSTPQNLATVNARPARRTSQLATSVGHWLHTHLGHGSDVHWGNEGFMVDVALHHPKRIEDVTIGVLCDMNRYAGTDDPIEWEVFRTGVHERNGWKLHRLWSPHFYRDPRRVLLEIEEKVRAEIDNQPVAR